MALKAKLETMEGLPAELVKEYKLVEEGDKKVYVLDLEGGFISDEPVDALKRAKEHEKKNRHEAEKKTKDLEAVREQLQTEIDEMRRGNIPKNDVDKLEKSWKEKLDKVTTEKDGQIGARDRTLQKILVDNIAHSIASKISIEGSADLMLPHIRNRLTTELVDGEYITRVLDKDGKPSASSIEELQKEFTTDKRFAPIIIGSKASGGGASGGGSGSGAPPAKPDPKFDLNKATPKELAAHLASKRAAAKKD